MEPLRSRGGREICVGRRHHAISPLGCELQADWKLPTANDMLAPFIQNLPEYGFVLQNFWNNANQHTVPDPFEMVK